MAPSRPPPPRSEVFAALKTASPSSVVMSATTISSRAPRWLTDCTGVGGGIGAFLNPSTSRPFRARLGAEVESAAHPDIVEMRIQEAARGATAVGAEHAEEVVIGRQLGIGRVCLLAVAQRDTMSIDAAVLAGPKAARQAVLVNQAGDELDGAVLRRQR